MGKFFSVVGHGEISLPEYFNCAQKTTHLTLPYSTN